MKHILIFALLAGLAYGQSLSSLSNAQLKARAEAIAAQMLPKATAFDFAVSDIEYQLRRNQTPSSTVAAERQKFVSDPAVQQMFSDANAIHAEILKRIRAQHAQMRALGLGPAKRTQELADRSATIITPGNIPESRGGAYVNNRFSELAYEAQDLK